MKHLENEEDEDDRWKLGLIVGIKSYCDLYDISFHEIYAFFCEFIAINVLEEWDEEDAREVCRSMLEVMTKRIEMRRANA